MKKGGHFLYFLSPELPPKREPLGDMEIADRQIR